jgi:hypothetical protein
LLELPLNAIPAQNTEQQSLKQQLLVCFRHTWRVPGKSYAGNSYPIADSILMVRCTAGRAIIR